MQQYKINPLKFHCDNKNNNTFQSVYDFFAAFEIIIV